MSSYNEMDRSDYLKICNLVIELTEMTEKYDMKEITYMGKKIIIEKDRDEELIVK